MKTAIIISIISILLYTCGSLLEEDDTLSIEKKPYLGKEFRIDGYYFDKYSNDEYRDCIFFYKNGVILNGGGWKYSLEKEKEKEEEYKNGAYYNFAKTSKISWGVFEIDGNTIRFERWYSSSGGPLSAYVREGVILNDTTFRITQSYRMQNGKKTEERSKDELYSFKELSPKPDSTNVFVP